MIGIVDYGLGNITSVVAAIERVGHQAIVTSDPVKLAEANKLIIPGVGAFPDGMRSLRERGLIGPLTRMVKEEKKQVLGICLGCQLLTHESDEFGRHEGLGWVEARVRRFAPDHALRIPHVGWNDTTPVGYTPLFDGLDPTSLFYYVHSHYIVADDPGIVAAECEYGVRFVAGIAYRNVFGVQFHPEKSQRDGLRLLDNFMNRC